MDDIRILFIGAGNMGQSIITGINEKKLISKKNIYFFEPQDAVREKIKNKLGVEALTEINESIKDFDMIVLSVKPQVFNGFKNDNIMSKLSDLTNKNQVIVSIMAGITIDKIQAFFHNSKQIVRIMPNTPALIGEGMSAIAPSENVSSENLDIVMKIFECIGCIEKVDEKMIDAVTGLSGSGPAFVMTFIEALTQGGVLCGLPKITAEKLAIQTVLGSALMASNGERSVEELRHMVTSPGGTTIAGIAALEENGFRNSVIKAVKSAYQRSKELGQQ